MSVPFLLFCLVAKTSAVILSIPRPPIFDGCMKHIENATDFSQFVGKQADDHCWSKSSWLSSMDRGNFTQDTAMYFAGMTTEFLKEHKEKRSKRAAGPGPYRRPEIRQMSNKARHRFFAALNKMKKSGEYDRFAAIHVGIIARSAHYGPNFGGWHRVLLLMFEKACQKYDPKCVIPYWDSTIENGLKDPTQSHVWGRGFFGNCNGFVTTGPFAHWQTPYGPLTRNCGGASRPMSKKAIMAILSRCRTKEISDPWAKPKFNFEIEHGSCHAWVGGHFRSIQLAGYDPLFWMHHAFIDYIWEKFRHKQRTKCGVNPTTDYPHIKGPHNANRPMDVFQKLRNIDGYSDVWTSRWYRYTPAPSCGRGPGYGYGKGGCGSPYLYCGGYGDCLPLTLKQVGEGLPYGLRQQAIRRGEAQAASIFTSMDLFRAPGDSRGRSRRSRYGHLSAPYQNNFYLDGQADAGGYSYMPVAIYHTRGKGYDFGAYGFQGGAATKTDFYNPSGYGSLASHWVPGQARGYSNCGPHYSGAGQVHIQSKGINNNAYYQDYALYDGRHAVSSGMAYMGFKNPKHGMSEVMFSASDHCGRICQPRCLVPGSSPVRYSPCSGALRVTSDYPKGYADDYGSAVNDVYYWDGHHPNNGINNVHLAFHCNHDDHYYSNYNQGSYRPKSAGGY